MLPLQSNSKIRTAFRKFGFLIAGLPDLPEEAQSTRTTVTSYHPALGAYPGPLTWSRLLTSLILEDRLRPPLFQGFRPDPLQSCFDTRP